MINYCYCSLACMSRYLRNEIHQHSQGPGSGTTSCSSPLFVAILSIALYVHAHQMRYSNGSFTTSTSNIGRDYSSTSFFVYICSVYLYQRSKIFDDSALLTWCTSCYRACYCDSLLKFPFDWMNITYCAISYKILIFSFFRFLLTFVFDLPLTSPIF